MPPEEVVKGYVIAREILGMRALWGEIEALDNKVPAALQARMLVECGRLIERETDGFRPESDSLSTLPNRTGVSARVSGRWPRASNPHLGPAPPQPIDQPPTHT